MGEDPGTIRNEIEDTRGRMGDTVDALAYKADVKSRAKDSVTDKVDTLKSKITGATDSVAESTPSTGEVKAKGRRAVGIAQENPLGLAIGGIAVGFLAGLLVPTSRLEDEKIGPMAEQVREQVKQTGQEALEHGKEVAQEAASSAADTAKEAGREHAEELRDSTQERAGQVGSTG
jgi:gas vesicle protein/phage tail protein X